MFAPSSEAFDLIKSFESLELHAYPDPGTGGEPFTIGWGHTGQVKSYDTCTQQQADVWLEQDVAWAVKALNDGLTVPLTQSQVDGLTSFVYNVGSGAFFESTLRRRLNEGEPANTVISEELPRWNKGGSGIMLGLVRRREAEVALCVSDGEAEPVEEDPKPISLVDAATYFANLDHQVAAFEYVETVLETGELDHFAELYRGQLVDPEMPLQAPYYYQLDSETPEGFRMCFSSTNAMLLEYLKPGSLKKGGDDEYLRRVHHYGDTTDSSAQVKALQSYGIDCQFLTFGDIELLEDQIAKGYPVPVGWLHKCHVSEPCGGGHWSLVVHVSRDFITVHDPFGRAAMTKGGYESNGFTDGRFVQYDRESFAKRWMPEGPGSGWLIEVL